MRAIRSPLTRLISLAISSSFVAVDVLLRPSLQMLRQRVPSTSSCTSMLFLYPDVLALTPLSDGSALGLISTGGYIAALIRAEDGVYVSKAFLVRGHN